MRDSLNPINPAFGNKLTQSRKVASRTAPGVAYLPMPGHHAQSPCPSDIIGKPRPLPREVAMHREEGFPIHTGDVSQWVPPWSTFVESGDGSFCSVESGCEPAWGQGADRRSTRLIS